MSSGRAWMIGLQMLARQEADRKEQKRAKHFRIMKHSKEFTRIFGVAINQFYNDVDVGFDQFAFDDYLMTQDEQYRKANAGELGEDANVCMADHITAKYGEAACNMIESFI